MCSEGACDVVLLSSDDMPNPCLSPCRDDESHVVFFECWLEMILGQNICIFSVGFLHGRLTACGYPFLSFSNIQSCTSA